MCLSECVSEPCAEGSDGVWGLLAASRALCSGPPGRGFPCGLVGTLPLAWLLTASIEDFCFDSFMEKDSGKRKGKGKPKGKHKRAV